MNRAAIAAGVSILLAGCQPPPRPADYHVLAQHAFAIRESVHDLQLAGASDREMDARVQAFATGRPNNGSSFTVSADPVTGALIRTALIATGVAPADILLTPSSSAPALRRLDRIAIATGCYGAPTPHAGLALDDGFSHDNTNSALHGCSVRRNVAAMADDPRTLFNESPAAGRDGARAADVYGKWTRGRRTDSEALTAAPTSPLGGGGK